MHLPGATLRPIDQWPGKLTPASRRLSRYRFQATWSSTRNLLQHELGMIQARNTVLQLAISDADIRRDGGLRAHARPEHPGIILAFDSSQGSLQFACDTYETAEANARAIALTLQALRAVERYGATKTGEQYRGWQALPAPSNGQMTVEQAAAFIAEHATAAGLPIVETEVLGGWLREAYRHAAKRLHPDAGGDPELFRRLQDAKRLLDQAEARP